MSDLSSRKTRCILHTADVVREKGNWRAVVVEAHPTFASVRLSGLRTSYTVEWSAIFHLAARLQAESVRKEKRAKRGKR